MCSGYKATVTRQLSCTATVFALCHSLVQRAYSVCARSFEVGAHTPADVRQQGHIVKACSGFRKVFKQLALQLTEQRKHT
eukprot:19700-Heterococcus_DN1.PRE.2